MSHRDADVMIAGAGPAGSALAIHLARQGREVLLIDRSVRSPGHADHSRHREAGDFYTGRPALNLLTLKGGQHNVVASGGFVIRWGE